MAHTETQICAAREGALTPDLSSGEAAESQVASDLSLNRKPLEQQQSSHSSPQQAPANPSKTVNKCSTNETESPNALEEFERLKIMVRAKKQFAVLDMDNTGVLAGAELVDLANWVWLQFHPGGEPLSAALQAEHAARLLRRLDVDGDGVMNFEEFSEWFTRTCALVRRYRQGAAIGVVCDQVWGDLLSQQALAATPPLSVGIGAASRAHGVVDHAGNSSGSTIHASGSTIRGCRIDSQHDDSHTAWGDQSSTYYTTPSSSLVTTVETLQSAADSATGSLKVLLLYSLWVLSAACCVLLLTVHCDLATLTVIL